MSIWRRNQHKVALRRINRHCDIWTIFWGATRQTIIQVYRRMKFGEYIASSSSSKHLGQCCIRRMDTHAMQTVKAWIRSGIRCMGLSYMAMKRQSCSFEVSHCIQRRLGYYCPDKILCRYNSHSAR